VNPKELKVVFGENYKIDVEYKGFTVKTDQPVREGGDGTAPAPFDYFLISLAACAGFYALAFCRERKIATEGLAVTMTAEKGESSRLIEKITVTIQLPLNFPEKYKLAVVKAVDHCTVKANILQAPRFEIIARP